ncbi:MAG: CAP domain-containing protein [Bacteroidota bacterium]
MIRKCISTLAALILLGLVADTWGMARAQGGYDPTTQTPELLYDEARTVYLGNLARRDNGVPPLRWNRQLTYAARWFSWDSTENRPDGYCGHQDTLGHWPDYRARSFGYLGSAGAENAFCGYVTPEYAIQGWMNSPGHRANLLDPNSREIGLGYYRRSSDGRGYVTQDFGNDAVYAPVIIENEALSTTSPNVNLYIYDRSSGGGFAGFSAATQMMISNNLHFSGAAWEPYKANKAWTLAGGSGWRNVYVKTRDKFKRTLTASDTIYAGASVPLSQLGSAQMSTTQPKVKIYYLDGGTWPQVQFSAGWLADDTFGTFGKLWGNGERVNDPAARGGTAYRLYPGDGESAAWVWDTTFIKDTPMTAYFRLKVNNNTSDGEVARISINGGGKEYGPLSLRGTDFTAPDKYQEFPLNFTFNTDPDNVFLIFNFWRSGDADLYVDAVTIFSAPQAITSPLTWSIPGKNYRGQGIWLRYTNGSQFSGISEAVTVPYTISGNAGAAGAMLSYTDGTPRTVTADARGKYSIIVPYGWSGTVTPSHPCYAFTPESRPYDHVDRDFSGQKYTASPSGRCVKATFYSTGAYDGWILESGEASSQGGTLNAAGAALVAGDDAQDRQYRSILSFNTAALPDAAVITNVALKLKGAGAAGTNPFGTHGTLLLDVRKGPFSSNPALQPGDFQAAAGRNAALTITNNPVEGWYSGSMTSAAFGQINQAGITQFRLRFAKDDNDDLSADYIKFYSGNAAAAYRPVLVVEYYLP